MAHAGIRFFWNGLKGSDGKLIPASFSLTMAWWRVGAQGERIEVPTHIAIHARHARFPAEVATEFEIKNDSDPITDYYEKDLIRVLPSHPRFADVAAALVASLDHFAKWCDHRGMITQAAAHRNQIVQVHSLLRGSGTTPGGR